MTQEEKQLLLKDLCDRVIYSPTVHIDWGWLDAYDAVLTLEKLLDFKTHDYILKPYLRPMSSMTEEEKKIMRSCGFELIHYDTGYTGFANIESCIDEVSFRFMVEFLSAHHFDYRGLIEKGLALEAPEGMYKID